MLTREQIEFAAENLKGEVRRTELIHSPYYSSSLGVPLYFKCENLQHTGSFKIRGAYHCLSQKTPQQLGAGVITASAGNHAQGLAYAARLLDCPCHVIMPEGTPLAKELATLDYGAEVEIHGANFDEAVIYAKQLAQERELFYVPAFDDELIMAGQGTIGLELLEDLPELDTLIVPIGGGGLISGIATAVCETKPSVRVIGVEAASVASAQLARRKGRPVKVPTRCHSLADGIAVKQVGDLTFPIIERYVEEIVTVEEEAIAMAIVSLMERGKLVVEGSGAVGLAAMLFGLKTIHKGTTVCLLSGGNLDVQTMARVVERGMLAEGRYLKLRLEMIDMPGALAELTKVLSEIGANIFQVSHDRHKSSLPLGEAEVILDLETRGPGHIQEILLVLEEEGYRPEVLH
ncbi:L-threonine ammonia-lyase [Malonomonas rubra DSM 5091]|uniref:L-threonine ammonia-lyase n=1 Tax=Malonomonas rubra DSM 5091 TaxID=1122189 RepID=A0A1M6IWC3_MALRU|nr:threonine ammonia-lyase [Malonomonas rubra]SHJ38738.1 L-threonine ammonia-lyase [Malonomonas rubra DSM 5091]